MISHLELLNFNWMTCGQLYIDLIPSHYSTFSICIQSIL